RCGDREPGLHGARATPRQGDDLPDGRPCAGARRMRDGDRQAPGRGGRTRWGTYTVAGSAAARARGGAGTTPRRPARARGVPGVAPEVAISALGGAPARARGVERSRTARPATRNEARGERRGAPFDRRAFTGEPGRRAGGRLLR